VKSKPLPPFPVKTAERAALDNAVTTCLDLNQTLIETAVGIQQCDLENHEQPWRVVENTLALAGALANLLHQIHSKRPGVNAPVADMLTETRPTRMDLPDHAPTTADATADATAE
jgi:hypothetical protein